MFQIINNMPFPRNFKTSIYLQYSIFDVGFAMFKRGALCIHRCFTEWCLIPIQWRPGHVLGRIEERGTQAPTCFWCLTST